MKIVQHTMTIVAAVDSSERASKVVDQANELAKKFDENIHIIHVMNRSEVIEHRKSDVNGAEAVGEDGMRSTARKVALEMLDEHPTTVETEVTGLIGNPADEIVKFADKQDAKYVIVSPKRQSKTGKILFGSVAQSILLNASCPVISVTDI
jgi:nucleotide-binding universal stress UspA family protein